MAVFSWLSNTEARAVRRRMSLPEAGFATKPTAGRLAWSGIQAPISERDSATILAAFGR